MTDLAFRRDYARLRAMRRRRTDAEIDGDFRLAQELKDAVDALSLALAEGIVAMQRPPRDEFGRFVSRSARP